MTSRSRPIALAVSAALLAAAPLPAATAARIKAKHYAGQPCSAKKQAPKGFRCEKRNGKYVLMKSRKK
jgi:hypothetical protein